MTETDYRLSSIILVSSFNNIIVLLMLVAFYIDWLQLANEIYVNKLE